MKSLYSSDRRFQLWEYSVSHGQLLLRSNPTEYDHVRIELYFKGVSFISLPSSLDGVDVLERSRDSLPGFLARLGNDIDCRAFVLKSKDEEFFVLALALFVHQAELEFFEPSVFFERSGDARHVSDPLPAVTPDVRRL